MADPDRGDCPAYRWKEVLVKKLQDLFNGFQGLRLGLAVCLLSSGAYAQEEIPLASAVMAASAGGLYMLCMTVRDSLKK